jgi:hypothetical protein
VAELFLESNMIEEQNAATPETPEEAKRRYDRDRKREQRKRERSEREQITKQQQAKLAAEAASADAERIKQERIGLIRQEFSQPIQPDEILEDGTSYWSWVLDEVELYLAEFKHMNFEQMYNRLSICPEGQLILRYFGVEPLPPPPQGWTYLLGESLRLFKQPHGPSIDLWEGLTKPELEARAKEWAKPSTPSPVVQYKQDYNQELLDFYKQRIADKTEEIQAEITQKKKVYADKIRVQQLLWQTGRAAKANAPRQQPPTPQETPLPLLEQALRDRRDASWSE